MIKLKRVYEDPSPADGFRVLVECLWPRGLTKERVAIDLWLKEVAPSIELRQWFGHNPERWEEFCRRYRAELKEKDKPIKFLTEKSRAGIVTFVYATRDEKHNSALVLKEFIEHTQAG